MNRNPSLERLISPDRADVLPSVNHPPKRLFLAGALLLAILGCAWFALGVIDTRIKGRCILLSPQGVDNLSALVEGRVSGLAVRNGDKVAAGQVLATMRKPEFEARMARAEARLGELRVREQSAATLISRSAQQGRSSAVSEQATLAERLKTLAERQRLARQRVTTQEALFAQGLATRQSLLSAQDAAEKLALEESNLNSRMRQLSFHTQEEQRLLATETSQLALQVTEAERELALLRKQERELMQVRAPFAGTVIEVKTQNGQALAAGGPVATIERSGNDGAAPLQALVFVRAADGKLLHPSMQAEITPTNVKRQEFGFIRASIGEVSAFPASRAAIVQRLGNPDVVQELSGTGVTTQVQATLQRRPDGVYQWSGAARLPPPVHSGSMCSAEVVVREQHPYELVWPMMKKLVGVS